MAVTEKSVCRTSHGAHAAHARLAWHTAVPTGTAVCVVIVPIDTLIAAANRSPNTFVGTTTASAGRRKAQDNVEDLHLPSFRCLFLAASEMHPNAVFGRVRDDDIRKPIVVKVAHRNTRRPFPRSEELVVG